MPSRVPDPKSFRVTERRPVGAPPAEVPDVTVVTVVFNAVKSGRAAAFAQCLESVQAQTGCAVEHVVVDGASKDGTVDVIASCEPRAVPVRWISEPDHGIYEAMNRGIALARGRYVVFLNSDDFFNDPQGMADSVRALDASSADYSYAAANVVDDAGLPFAHVFTEADESVTMMQGMTICHQTILFRRSTLLELDGYDLTYRSASDYDLFLRFIYGGHRGVRVDRRFATFRAGGFSSINAELSEHEVDAIFRKRFATDCGYEASEKTVSVMRLTGEYPERLMDRLLEIGTASFPRPISPTWIYTPVWAKRTYGELVYAIRDWIWSRSDEPAFWDKPKDRVRDALRFLCVHPLGFLSALKTRLFREKDGAQTLFDAGRDRCEGWALERFTFVAPRDVAKAGGRDRCFRHGVGCDRAFSVRVSRTGRCDTLALILSACAYGTADTVARIRCNGGDVGSAVLRPQERPRLHVFPLPDACRNGGELTVEVIPSDGCSFVFGGLAVGLKV